MISFIDGVILGVAVYVLMRLCRLVVRRIGGNSLMVLLVQVTAAIIASVAAKVAGVEMMNSVVATAIISVPIFVYILRVIVLRYMEKRALSGKMGKEVKWAGELFDEEDTEFMMASMGLSKSDLREIGIIAESKNELRELTVERYNEES